MAAFSTSIFKAPPHSHAAEDSCPWCDQPVPRAKFEEITGRIAAREREQYAELTARLAEKAKQDLADVEARAVHSLDLVRKEAIETQAKMKQEAATREAVIRQEAATAATAALQAQLAEAEKNRIAAEERLAALSASNDAKLADARDALEKEKATAILAEQAKAFEANQKFQEKVLDLQRQLEKKTASELGDVAEIDLFELLRDAFAGDQIRRVAKGANGADVIHEIVHKGRVCGKIIYDSKNRNAWQNGFASKLRADQLEERADHAILSSNKFPAGASQLHIQDGIIVAHPQRVLALAQLLRRNVLQSFELAISNEARESKTEALYAFVTSDRCRQLLDAVDSHAAKMADLDKAEERAHRRTWEQRGQLIRAVQKTHADLCFEIDRVIGFADNGPQED